MLASSTAADTRDGSLTASSSGNSGGGIRASASASGSGGIRASAAAPAPAARPVSLPGLHGSVSVPGAGEAPGWRRFLSFCGPGLLIAVGYIDPGNMATDIAAGSAFGYLHLSVVLASSVLACFLQALCCRLGLATGRDLAQACAAAYPRWAVVGLWLSAEVAIAATDLAEVIGSAIALKLLFGLPPAIGVWLTAADVLLLLACAGQRMRLLEALVGILLLLVVGCFGVELVLAQPDALAVLAGFLPSPRLVTEPGAMLLAVAILGATIMPHNLYLGSALVLTRRTAEAAAAPAADSGGIEMAAAAPAPPARLPALAAALPPPSRAERVSIALSTRVRAVAAAMEMADSGVDGEAVDDDDDEAEGGGGESAQLLRLPAAAAAARAPPPASAGGDKGAASSDALGEADEELASSSSSSSAAPAPALPRVVVLAAPPPPQPSLASLPPFFGVPLDDDAAHAAKASALRCAVLDIVISLTGALFVNAAILIVAAAAFHDSGHADVATLDAADVLLASTLGSRVAGVAFAVALLAAGQSSTLTGTLVGQIVMEGFVNWRIAPPLRRVLTRLVAIVPASLAAALAGEAGLNQALIVSQVVLAFQLPFAIFPLVAFIGDARVMGRLALSRPVAALGWAAAVAILALNVWLIGDLFFGAVLPGSG